MNIELFVVNYSDFDFNTSSTSKKALMQCYSLELFQILRAKKDNQRQTLWFKELLVKYTVRKANFPIHEIVNIPRNKNLTLMCNMAIEREFCQLLGHMQF